MKLLTATALACAIASPCVFADAYDPMASTVDYDANAKNSGFYLGLNYLNLPSQHGSFGGRIPDLSLFGLNFGYQFSPYFGIEADYNYGLEKSFEDEDGDKAKLTPQIYGVAVTYQYPIANGFYVKSALGASWIKGRVKYQEEDLRDLNDTYKKDGVFRGSVGIGYEVRPFTFVETTYNRIDKFNGIQFQIKHVF
ncbi:porin family protein [Acinetobacter sp. P1(2025)]|uniref:porin family protein n=1 Tax=Acinetobacter sp. P1(2025) TaxID=3446120 RepID=UPI003F52D6F7